MVKVKEDHKKRLLNFKNKVKQMKKEAKEMAQNNNDQTGGQQYPPIQNVPIWDKNADIIVKGYEWEMIYNGVVQLQSIGQAAQSVMSNNITNGTIKMDFRKLNPETLQYEQMTDEEKAPYQKEFADVIQKVKQAQETIANGIVNSQTVTQDADPNSLQEDLPKQDLPTTNGPKEKPEGKVVTMEGSK